MSTGLRIELRNDPVWNSIGGLAVAATVATIAWLILIAPMVAACAFLMVAGFVWQEWRARRRRPVALSVDAERQWTVEFEEENPASGRLQSSTVMPQLALVTVCLADGSTAGITVTPSMAGRDVFRRLCILLKHAVLPAQGATHES